MNSKNIKKLNIRGKQFYAALCVRFYCQNYKIVHPCIEELIDHCFRILTASDLPVWEQAGTKLCILGRGDPIPETVLRVIPSIRQLDFSKLIQNCVEVGIVDMYGVETDLPEIILEECFKILAVHRLELPKMFFKFEKLFCGDGWGKAIDDCEFSTIWNAIGHE